MPSHISVARLNLKSEAVLLLDNFFIFPFEDKSVQLKYTAWTYQQINGPEHICIRERETAQAGIFSSRPLEPTLTQETVNNQHVR